MELARILKDEGYITDYAVVKGESFDTLVIELKYTDGRRRVIIAAEADQQAGSSHLRQERQAAQGPRGPGHGRHLHLPRTYDRPGSATAGCGRRSRLLRLVRLCLG